MASRLRMAMSAFACVAFGFALLGCTAAQPAQYPSQVVDAYRSFAANAPGTWVLAHPASAGDASPQISVRVAEATAANPVLGVVTVTDSQGQAQQLVAYFAHVVGGSYDPPILIMFGAAEVDPQGNPSGAEQGLFLRQEQPGHWVLVRFDPVSVHAVRYQRLVSP